MYIKNRTETPKWKEGGEWIKGWKKSNRKAGGGRVPFGFNPFGTKKEAEDYTGMP